ncbi:MAG: copper transporter [Flavobacteriales bacterium]|nr:copper transporter [Flavobacteriales bacterium]|tara:strand:- start:9102 stop:12578 length:3477 start_codon:yes stop_codon:yes gene_type:complete
MSDLKEKGQKEFKASSWAIDNQTVIYVLIFVLLIAGISSYSNLPRESFPEIVETKIYISTPYPGNTAEDIERLITDPIEEEVENVSNVVEVLSTSQQDYGIITVEFDENITVEQAKQKVKDEVDAIKAGEDWPTFNGAKVEPNVFDLNFSEEMPILNINISGDYTVDQLKEFAEHLQEKVEDVPQIKQADIRGVDEKEVEVAIDLYKMMAARVSFNDVVSAISNGNMTISAGNLVSNGQQRTIRVLGEIERPEELNDFVVKTQNGAVYLRDIAKVSFKEGDKTTYAREFGESVVMLDVKKRGGKNMVEAAQRIQEIVEETVANDFPKDLSVTIANDQSTKTINQVNDLVNNIIFGIILVVAVLMFFLGFRNALFVGFAIPMSMFISFMIIGMIGYTLNTMVLFALVMGLGMLVDNGIVVVENVYRLMDEEGMSRIQAAKQGVGEIALPIIISTLTTVAAFFPLGFWPGVVGSFMMIFPITLSVVLGSSLIVALFFNSVLVSRLMGVEEKSISKKPLIKVTIIFLVLGGLMLMADSAIRGLGTLLWVTAILMWVYKYFLMGATQKFQRNFLPILEEKYRSTLRFALKGKMAYVFLFGTIGIFILSIITTIVVSPKVEFFPENEPNQIIVYIEYPEGTDIDKTNEITKSIEKRVYDVVLGEKYTDGDYNFMVESAVSQVGEGAGNPRQDGGSQAEMPHRGKITVSLREFKYRRGYSSENMRLEVQEALRGIYPGVSISVEKDEVGPPVGYPVNIEITGNDYTELIKTAEEMRAFINSTNIAGIEELKIDVNKSKPAMEVEIDREKAGELGISASQVGNQLRNSIFGSKAGVYKEDGDDYDIYVRFNEENRYNMSSLFNQNITFRDAATGVLKEIPVSTVAEPKYMSSFSAIKHKNTKRVVTLYSAVLPGFNGNEIVTQVKQQLQNFEVSNTVSYSFTGEIEEQEDNMSFLLGALGIGLSLIVMLLVLQFNSFSKPLIIMFSILLSFSGVFFGIAIFNMNFVIMMTMLGIISLAGIVVNNSVVLIDYTDILLRRRQEKLGVTYDALLPRKEVIEVVIQAGKARLRPVLLTAITTVLGLIPLATGLNIDFAGLFINFNPDIYTGGDNVMFWGPLAWTVIFGLTFATFLTLVIVPVCYYLVYRIKLKVYKNRIEKIEPVAYNR